MLTYRELIKKRKSIRNYENKALSESLVARVNEIISNPVSGPFGNTPRFALFEKPNIRKERKIKLGTYGFISNANYFIGGCVEKFQFSEVDYGYSMEKTILDLTGLDLGTCWIGGTFNRKDYKFLLETKENEIIPCITPVGYISHKKRIFENILKKDNSKINRKTPETLFFENNIDTPIEFNKKYKYNQALEMLRLAPSALNKQPWRVIKIDNIYHFYINSEKKNNQKGIDLQKVDMGIALFHFKVSVDELLLNGKWHIADPDICKWEYIISWIAE